jgi:hypothetical protein
MTHFRKRLGGEILDEVNEWIALEEARKSSESYDSSDNNDEPGNGATAASDETAEPQLRQMELTNEGELLLDAT